MSPYALFLERMFPPPFFLRYFKSVISNFKNGRDHKIVKYSVILGGDRFCTIIYENQDIYVVKGGNLRGFFFSLNEDSRIKWKLGTSEKKPLIQYLVLKSSNANLFLGRVTITQSGAISIFSSKEQELEQRAGMMKRLAFTIFCSEPDQYQKSMPDIQG